MAMPLPSSRRALSALTVMGWSESRSKAVAEFIRPAARTVARSLRTELFNGFIASFHLGIQFQNAFVDPRFHALCPSCAKGVGDCYRVIGINHALLVIQRKAFGVQCCLPVANCSHHPNVSRKVEQVIVLAQGAILGIQNPRAFSGSAKQFSAGRLHCSQVAFFELLYPRACKYNFALAALIVRSVVAVNHESVRLCFATELPGITVAAERGLIALPQQKCGRYYGYGEPEHAQPRPVCQGQS